MSVHSADGHACQSVRHVSRRTLLQAGGAAGALWLTPLAELLAKGANNTGRTPKAQSIILLWLSGGPSQLETFDPHPGTVIAGGTRAIQTTVPGVQLAEGYEQLAEQMRHVALVRSVVSKEGDHERARYNLSTGFRPEPTLVHPALGAVICHQLADNVEIPRHISILPDQWPGRGGYLGDQFDAFKVFDPQQKIPDLERRVEPQRFQRRIADLFNVVDAEFARGRLPNLDRAKTLHQSSIQAALRMMSSEQLKAFDLKQEPQSTVARFGDSSFGRGCLAAVRLIEVGVRCVEVTLGGWDSHANNRDIHARNAGILDPALAALLSELKLRDRLESTIVVCGGEFGRTPSINPAGGRDHWPHGFTIALAGGGICGGTVIGETSPERVSNDEGKNIDRHVKNPKSIADVHATILDLVGIDFKQQLPTPVGRPMIISEGQVITELVRG